MPVFEIISIKRDELDYEVIYLKDGVRWKDDFLSDKELTYSEIMNKIQTD